MSRIGKKPIDIPSGVKIELAGNKIKVSGPKGNLQRDAHSEIKVEVAENRVVVTNPQPENRRLNAMHGTIRALINNMIIGVSAGFERKMEIYGTGYNIKEQSSKLILQIGFCHPVDLAIPESVKVQIDTPATRGNDVPAKFTLTGFDKHELGQFAANIRRVRPPEPYKGKGIRYADEYIRRKVGKAFATGAA
jgi:large subunit ribosomal protein L6